MELIYNIINNSLLASRNTQKNRRDPGERLPTDPSIFLPNIAVDQRETSHFPSTSGHG